MGKIKIKQIIILALAFVVLFFLIFHPKGTEVYVNPNNQPAKPNPFSNLNLEAKAVYVFDLAKNEPIFDLNKDAQLPLASLTKIMTVVVAKELTRNRISHLIDSALMQSSNEAASALASLDNNFISLMNEKAKELDLNQTYFLNETGLDFSKNLAGGYGSASDIVKLIKYSLKNNPHLFEATTINSVNNTNPYATTTTELIASKTGWTDLAGGNLAVVFDAGLDHPIIAVVLGSSKEGRFKDIQKLIESTFKYLYLNIYH
jgi:D-alanyl-D-alanine carboxypeptidase (penicillin-binding protein 5/6)